MHARAGSERQTSSIDQLPPHAVPDATEKLVSLGLVDKTIELAHCSHMLAVLPLPRAGLALLQISTASRTQPPS